ncbi:hypothetical protein NW762_010980 [Fusarium torreyae]|uniref:Agmatinase 1 n=1 Tax=Fusarium torreyae TaxID=1237075 RepID=A0A9W8VCR8_9HYPO|nr:hypothetical protein NW762_010980 [Fusarium torreyae]
MHLTKTLWVLLLQQAVVAAQLHSNQNQMILNHDDDMDFVDSGYYYGISTFAHTRYVNCYSNVESKDNLYDIAIIGAPHDTTTTGRPGARFGPNGIRTGSQRQGLGWSIYTGRNPFASWATIVDCGDAHLTWLDNKVALDRLDKVHKVVSGRRAANASVSLTPRILTLGGDHTTTLSALRSTYERWGPVSVIHFDSHIDTWDPAVLGGDISDYAALNHGTFLHIAHEEHLILNSSIHAGVRGPISRRKDDLRNDIRCGFEILTARDLDKFGIQGLVSRIKERVGDSKVYISVDIDVLDPAFAPGTGTAEPGGWSTRELLSIIEELDGLPIVGADVVEVAPAYDSNGEITVLAAAEVACSLLDLMVENPVKSRADLP